MTLPIRNILMMALYSSCMAARLLQVRPAGAQEIPNLPALSPAELEMKDNPEQSGAPAMILYYAVETDNTKATETHATRIKVFTDEGKKYANIEIPYVEKYSEVGEIAARTISPDGRVTPFQDQIYDREIVKAKKFRYHAKVLILPNVQVGSLIEYAYTMHYKKKVPNEYHHPEQYMFTRGMTYPAAEWSVQRELFLKHGHFILVPVTGSRVAAFKTGLRADAVPKTLSDGRLQFDIDDVPGFEEEEYSPPEQNIKGRMNLYYAEGFYVSDNYWSGLGTALAKEYDSYIGLKRSKVIEGEIQRILSPNDDDEMKLRKIYMRAQQIRSTDNEEPKSDKEREREQLKENRKAEEVLDHNYGSGNEINLLFIAMARAAGFEAHPLLLSSRNHAFFQDDYPNLEQLNSMVAAVRTRGKYSYLDPQSPYCPFGLLPWSLTGTGGLLVDSSNPSLGKTPQPKSEDAVSRTVGNLKLSAEGTLTGNLTVSYEGQEALMERQWVMQKDDAKRREHLEETLKSALTGEARVKLLSVEGWEKTGEPLKIEYEIEAPIYATLAGQRLVMPLGVLHVKEKNPFPSPRRTHSVYFDYQYETYEDIKIELPAGMQAEGLPGNKKVVQGAVSYEFVAKSEGNLLQITRVRRTGAYMINVAQYPNLRKYFDQVLAGDSQQVVLRRAK